jgi:predicted ATP-dependent protease
MTPENQVAMDDAFRVPPEELSCAPISLKFGTTEEVEPLLSHAFIGQSRAEGAFLKGLATPGHIFVAGLGSINTALLEHIKKEAGVIMRGRRISDFVCVYNFENPSRPRFIELEKGHARKLERGIEKLLAELKEKIPAQLLGEEFKKSEEEIRNKYNKRLEDELSSLRKEMHDDPIVIQGIGEVVFTFRVDPSGVVIFLAYKSDLPKVKGMSPEEYEALGLPERKKIDEIRGKYLGKISEIMKTSRRFEQEANEETTTLKERAVEALFVEKSQRILAELGEAVYGFIDALREYTVGHFDIFLSGNNNHTAPMPFQSPADPFLAFKINVFVDNSKTEGIPVIDHRNVDYGRLFGEISYAIGPGGVPLGGHTNIRAGLLSEANHGILVLSAKDIFGISKFGIWDKLKAVLETKRLDIGHSNSYANLVPETLHIDVKLVLVGSWDIYLAFNGHGAKEDFDEIFKTVAEFDSRVHRSDEVIGQFAGLIRLFCDRDDLPPVSCDGVAEFLKYLSRLEEDQSKFSLDLRSLKDILNEAAWLAKKESNILITADNARQAINNKVYRVGLIRDKVYEHIENGDKILKLDGSEVGQVNGLAVYDPGDISFGVPSRITAKTFAGKQGIVNIEREAGLSGRTHNKGVLVLGGYIGAKYAQEKPLSFSATLSFEQSHEVVDGDSASSTELYAILSSLSGFPIRQDIAVTGAVGQNGEIQPIGGVNQKVEGFFDICSVFGLTGRQGVIIAKQNVKNLVLREDVITAVKEGKFHVYAVSAIEEGMEILTGQKMGERAADGLHKGEYPVSSINYRVEIKLRKLAKASQDNGKTN